MIGLDWTKIIEQYSASFAAAMVEPGALGRAVPACPDWTGLELVLHLGEVQLFWAEAVRTGGGRPEPPSSSTTPQPGEDPLDWYQRCRSELVTALCEADPMQPCWAWWASGRTVAEVARRQAHEAAVHRWDAQSVIGQAEPLGPVLGADGVDEFLDVMVASQTVDWTGPGGVLVLAATDVDRVWTVELGGARPAPRPARAGGSVEATLRATASDLDLLLWRRPGLEAPGVRVDGAPALATAFLEWTRLD